MQQLGFLNIGWDKSQTLVSSNIQNSLFAVEKLASLAQLE